MKGGYRCAVAVAAAALLCGPTTAQQPNEEEGAVPGSDFETSLALADYLGSEDLRATELIGGSVRGADGDEVGEIQDLVVSREDDVVAAVISVGGFLNLGEKAIAVPYEELRVSPDGRDFYVAMSQQELEAFPEYRAVERDSEVLADLRERAGRAEGNDDADRRDALAAAAGDSQERVDTRAGVSAESAPAVDAGDTQAAARSDESGVTSRSGDQSAAGSEPRRESSGATGAAAIPARRASMLIGSIVVSADGDEVGSVDDIIVSPQNGEVHAVLGIGGLLGVGQRLIAVPLDQIRFPQEAETDAEDGAQSGPAQVRLAMTVDELREQPIYRYEVAQGQTTAPF